ncbi:MAG: hypothetical protein V3U18_02455 [Alphaproteobacteria bacterium]
MVRLTPIREFTLTLAVALAIAFGAAQVRADEIEGWPCKRPYAESLSAETAWGGTPPKADGDWREDKAVSELVMYATNPEINPAHGREAISEFAPGTGSDRDASLALAFHGMFEEMNSYYRIIITGIGHFVIKAKILEEAVAENDTSLAALPEDATEARRDIRIARMWNFRNMDDAEEEAGFQCRRLTYLEKKLGLLTEQLRSEMRSN